MHEKGRRRRLNVCPAAATVAPHTRDLTVYARDRSVHVAVADGI